jgi:hypothetical protein
VTTFKAVTVTLAQALLPELSVAFTVSVWLPFAYAVVFSEYDHDVVPLTNWYALLSTRSSTFETDTLSEALPETLNVPAIVAPAAGVEIATLGTCESTLLNVTPTLAQALFPDESVTLALSV